MQTLFESIDLMAYAFDKNSEYYGTCLNYFKDGAYRQGFYRKLGPRGKIRSLKGLLESTKKNWGSQAFFRDN